MNLKASCFVIFLVLVVDATVDHHEFNFSDLENITDSCYTRGTCQTRRGSRLDVNMDWKDTNCFCDDNCITYGDCCLEAKTYDANKMKTANRNFECVHIEPFGSFYMKGICMDGWISSEISDLCLKASPSISSYKSDPFLDIPVTSLRTDITYKNYYCGLCNNETMKDLEMWHAQLSCPEGDDIPKEYIKQNLKYVNESWGFYANDIKERENSFIMCEIFPVARETILHKIRRCRDFLANCSSNWTNTEVENLCHSYTTIVFGFPPEYGRHVESENKEINPYQLYSAFAYRNYHCAICNYIKPEDLTCSERIFRQTPLPVSFSVLFDFGETETGCGEGEIWNPFSKICRPVVCLNKQSEFRNGRCIKTFDKIMETTTAIFLPESENVSTNPLEENDNMKCDKMFINESDFTRTETDIIKVHTFRRTYDVDEYQNYKEGILVCIPNSYSRLMGWLTLVGLGLSCLCIVVHLITFSFIPELRNLSGKNLASMCVALLIAYICFLISSFKESGTSSCPILASLMYYFFLASFSWMNVMAFDVWRTLKRATSELRLTSGRQWKKFIFYSLYAWILPLALLIMVLLFDYTRPSWIDPTYLPELGYRLCWFGQRKAILVYFAVPLAIIMVLNIICFILAVKMVSPSSSVTNTCSHTHQVQLKLYLRLALLMGLSWISGIIGGYIQSEYFWYMFIILNAFQGLFIFLGFTCTKKVSKALKGAKSLRSSIRRSGKDLSRQVLGYQDSNNSNMSNTSSTFSTTLSTITEQSTLSKSSLRVQSP